MSTDSVVVTRDGQGWAVAVADIRRMQVQTGSRRNGGRGAGIGAGVGLVAQGPDVSPGRMVPAIDIVISQYVDCPAMPAYDYQCPDCGNAFTLRLSISAYTAGVKVECPACGSAPATRRLGAVNVLGGSRAGGTSPSSGCGSTGFT